jgi:mRNA interferase MazF
MTPTVTSGRGGTSLSSSPGTIQRGEIWLVSFDPTRGAEIRKTRPAVVVSSDGIGRLPIKLVAPLTEWQETFKGNLWHVRLDPDSDNNLTKPSAADVLQLRGMDAGRFVRKLGKLSPDTMQRLVAAIAVVVEIR